MSQKIVKEERNLGLFDIFNLGFGGAVGSGIFVLMGAGIEDTGKSIVLAVVIGCLVMMLAYFYNILLSSMFSLTGGDYSQKAIALNPFFTGIGAYLTFVNGFSIAMYSVAIVEYSAIIFPSILPFTKIIAVIIITVLFGASIKGSKFISMINSFMAVVLIISILIFIIFGIPKVQPGYFGGSDFFRNGLPGFVAAIAIMGWACQGTTMGPVSVQAVTKNSRRTIPFAIFLITIAIAVVYGLMSYVAAGVLPVDVVAGQNLAIVAEEIFPRWIFVIFIIGGAVFAIFTSMITGITMVRYPILKVAQDGRLPQIFTKTTESGYPWVVYLLFYVLSILPVLLGFSLGVIVSLVMIPTMILNVYLNISCIRIMKEHKEYRRSSIMYVPGRFMDFVCILSALAAAAVCYNLFVALKPQEAILMIAILAIMSIMSIFCLRTGRVSKEKLEDSRRIILEEAYSVTE